MTKITAAPAASSAVKANKKTRPSSPSRTPTKRPSSRGRVVKKGEPIVIPNAEALADEYGEEEVARLKKNEAQRRLMQRNRGKEPTVALRGQEVREIETEDMVSMAKQTRNLSLGVLENALVHLMSDPEKLAKTNIATLATVFGIMYDKTQLMQGLSTQNIAINAKVDVNMNSDEAIQELNKMRSKFQEANDT